MERERASVVRAKNALSGLINKVAYGKTRVVLESHGKPKAALVSTEDLERLERLDRGVEVPVSGIQILSQARKLRRKIRDRQKRSLSGSSRLLTRLREERARGL